MTPPLAKPFVAPAPFLFGAYPVDNSPLSEVVRIYGAICVSVVAFLIIVSIILLFGVINYRIAFLQWRAIFIQFYFFFACGFFSGYLSQSGDSDPVLENYIQCIGSHPRIDPPPCEKDPGAGRVTFFATYLVIFLFPVVISLVVTLTNPHVFGWWKELILKRKMYRDVSELDSNSTTNREQRSTNPNFTTNQEDI